MVVEGIHGTPIVVGPDPPVVSEAWFHSGSLSSFYWWFNTTNRTWNQHNGSEWVPIGEVGMHLDATVEIKKITRLKIVGGMVTELEYEE